MNRIKTLVTLGVFTALCGAVGQSPENSTDVVPLKYDGLKQEVLKHRGKVLVVDFWAGT